MRGCLKAGCGGCAHGSLRSCGLSLTPSCLPASGDAQQLAKESTSGRVRCRDLHRELAAAAPGAARGSDGRRSSSSAAVGVAWAGVAEPVHGLPFRHVFFQALLAGQVPTPALLRGDRGALRRLTETHHDEWMSRDELLDAVEEEIAQLVKASTERPPPNPLKCLPYGFDPTALAASASGGGGAGGAAEEDPEVTSARVLLAFVEARLCGGAGDAAAAAAAPSGRESPA